MTPTPRSPTVKSECTVCPEWVLRCAHLEGQVVWLIDLPGWAATHGPYEARGQFTVTSGRLVTPPTRSINCDDWPHALVVDGDRSQVINDPAASVAAFGKRSELLRTGT